MSSLYATLQLASIIIAILFALIIPENSESLGITACGILYVRHTMTMMKSRYLYRGENEEMYQCSGGALCPKLIKQPFEHVFKLDGSIKCNGSATLGPSEKNAVYGHQLSSEKFPTSGISTTPVFQRAQYHATGGGRFVLGYVLKLDRKVLELVGAKEFIVSEWVDNPNIPEDEEVILVAQDMGELPRDVIVEVIQVSAERSVPPDRRGKALASR